MDGFGLYTTESLSQTLQYFAHLLIIKSITNWQKLLVQLTISQRQFNRIFSNFHILYKSTCSSRCLFRCMWLRPIYNQNFISNFTVFLRVYILKLIYTAKLNSQFLSGYFIRFFYTFIYCPKLFSLSTDC